MWPPRNLEQVVVCGNSGSLLDLPRQRSWPEDAYVLGCSRILRTGQDGRRYYPDCVILSDARPLETDREMLEDYPGTLLLADYLGTDLRCERFNGVPLRSRHARMDIPHFHDNQWGDPVWHIATVAFQATQLALRMLAPGGRVVLLGCESRWPPRGDSRRAKHHFYDDRGLKHKPFPVNRRYERQWSVLVDWAGSRGFRIQDGSPWRDLALPGLEPVDWERACQRR